MKAKVVWWQDAEPRAIFLLSWIVGWCEGNWEGWHLNRDNVNSHKKSSSELSLHCVRFHLDNRIDFESSGIVFQCIVPFLCTLWFRLIAKRIQALRNDRWSVRKGTRMKNEEAPIADAMVFKDADRAIPDHAGAMLSASDLVIQIPPGRTLMSVCSHMICAITRR